MVIQVDLVNLKNLQSQNLSKMTSFQRSQKIRLEITWNELKGSHMQKLWLVKGLVKLTNQRAQKKVKKNKVMENGQYWYHSKEFLKSFPTVFISSKSEIKCGRYCRITLTLEKGAPYVQVPLFLWVYIF